EAGRRGVADANGLVRLALSALRGAADDVAASLADTLERAPKRRGNAAIIRVAHDFGQLAVLDQLAPLAAELEFVARVVDRPGEVGLDVKDALDLADQFVELRLARFKVEVGHAVDGGAIPRA